VAIHVNWRMGGLRGDVVKLELGQNRLRLHLD